MDKDVLVVNGQHLNLNRCGGAGRYGRQLYKRLFDSDSSPCLKKFDLFLPNFQNVEECDLVTTSSIAARSVDLLKYFVVRCCPPLLFDRIQQVANFFVKPEANDSISVPSWSKLSRPTLLHELTNYILIDDIGRLSLSPNLILIVTFLDIQDYYYPDYFNDTELRSRRLAYSFYKDRADFFFAISEFTKKTMIDRLGILPEKIKVTHLAADDLLVLQPSEDIICWAKSFRRFWIYPAKAWKHKNHDFLIKALSKRKNELKRADVKLLLTGGFNDYDIHCLETLIDDSYMHDIVQILGFVSEEKLQALLRNADFLVFPSLFEGFGMPVLEAMTLGCPVLSSNAGSLPEVGGDAAMFFDPNCEDDFVALIDSVLTGRGIDRDSMIQKGFENCKRFSWEKTYRETVDVYQKLLP